MLVVADFWCGDCTGDAVLFVEDSSTVWGVLAEPLCCFGGFLVGDGAVI